MLEARQLTCGYGRRAVVREASLAIVPGRVICMLGPNGSGKTTLFKTILGFLRPLGGQLVLNGRDMTRMKRPELAQAMAYVPQAHAPSFAFRVHDVVMMGRTAHLGLFASPSRGDGIHADAALEAVGMLPLRDQPYTEISGGERQLVLIARALAQQARLMIMDEPTSNLDFGNQVRILEHVRRLATQGIGVLMTTHYPDHALQCADEVAILHRGELRLTGSPRETITAACLREIYGIEASVLHGQDARGLPYGACVPHFA